MSSKTKTAFFRTLAFRLTLMYSFLAAASLIGVLAVSYVLLDRTLRTSVDEQLGNEVEEYGRLLAAQDLDVLKVVLEQEAYSEGTDKVLYRIVQSDGTPVISTDASAWDNMDVDPAVFDRVAEHSPVFETRRHATRAHPSRVAYGYLTDGLVLQVAESTEAIAYVLQQFRRLFLAASATFLPFSLVIGWIMASRSLTGVRRVTDTAIGIAGGSWERRVPVSHWHDEIDELALAFNHMIERIQKLLTELRDVTDDIAHDLRTPIARIRGAAELALGKQSVSAGERETLGGIVEECDRLLQLIVTMLDIAQTESGVRTVTRTAMSLSEVAEDVCELFQPAAEDKQIDLRFSGSGDAFVNGDPNRLRSSIANLIDNSLKYTEPGGTVAVTCRRENGRVRLEVNDSGIGLSEEEAARVFDRFFRAEMSRSLPGNGLGLSLARAICRSHGGDIAVTSAPGAGSTFTITLPASKGPEE